MSVYTSASKKIIAECEAGAGTLKQSFIFIGMLEANGCDKHDPDDFTDEIMFKSMHLYIWSAFMSRGPFTIDVFEMLHGSFRDVSWRDTAVQDQLFDPIINDLGYGVADPRSSTVADPRSSIRDLEFFGIPGVLGNEPWRSIPTGHTGPGARFARAAPR